MKSSVIFDKCFAQARRPTHTTGGYFSLVIQNFGPFEFRSWVAPLFFSKNLNAIILSFCIIDQNYTKQAHVFCSLAYVDVVLILTCIEYYPSQRSPAWRKNLPTLWDAEELLGYSFINFLSWNIYCIWSCICFQRAGHSPYNHVFEIAQCEFNGQPAEMRVTSVLGHLMELEFCEPYNKWGSCKPEDLFEAPMAKSVTKTWYNCMILFILARRFAAIWKTLSGR